MAEDLTFAKPLAREAWQYEQSYTKSLAFYSATPTDTLPPYRFVAPSGHATAATAAGQFSKMGAAGDRILGYFGPQIRDDRTKEYYDNIAVGEQATIVLASREPVLVEAGSGIVDGEVKPNAEIMSDVDGKAVAMTATTGDVVAGHAAYTKTVNGVVYVAVLLATGGGRVA